MATARPRQPGRARLQSRNDLPPLYLNTAHGRGDGELRLRPGSPHRSTAAMDLRSRTRWIDALAAGAAIPSATALGDRCWSDAEAFSVRLSVVHDDGLKYVASAGCRKHDFVDFSAAYGWIFWRLSRP